MSETMIERVAKALVIAKFGPDAAVLFEPVPAGFPQSIEAQAAFHKRTEEARHEARAAIEAMRSYTDEMARKGCRAIQDFEEDDPQGMMMDFRWRSCWNAMLDAALSPPSNGEK